MKVNLADVYDEMKEALESGKAVAFVTNGVSMVPMLRDGCDKVYLRRKEQPEKNDVLFFRRADGSFVLHRIICKEKDGTFVLRGDNQFRVEKGITREQAIAVVESFVRNGKHIDCGGAGYRIYCAFLPVVRLLWRPFWRVADKIVMLANRRRKS